MLMMVTAFESEVLQQLARQQDQPIHDVLIKPVTPQQLASRIQQALQPATARVQKPARLPDKPLAGLSLLVVEDNALNREVAEQLLISAGARVTLAVDGFIAVALVHQQYFDLVLMDLQMPGMDGLTATKQIRQLYSAAQLPVVAMTANATADDQIACKDAGMNAHIAKPIDLKTLCPQLLALCGRAMPSSQTHSQGQSGSPQPADDSVLQPLPQLLSRFGDNSQLLYQAWQRLPQEWQQQTKMYAEAADNHARRAVLHTLQGVVATLGAVQLAQALRVAGRQLQQGLPADIQALQPLLEQSLRQFSQSWAEYSAQQPALTRLNPQALAESEQTEQTELLQQLELALQQQHLSALDLTARLLVTDQRYQQLSAQVEQLDFHAALNTLRQLARKVI